MSEQIRGRTVQLGGLRVLTNGDSVIVEMLTTDGAAQGKELPVQQAHLLSWDQWEAIVEVIGEKDELA